MGRRGGRRWMRRWMMMRIVSRCVVGSVWGCGMDVFIATAFLSFAQGGSWEKYISFLSMYEILPPGGIYLSS